MTMREITELSNRERPIAIPELSLPQEASLLVLAPHPDDFDAIGVTLRYFLQRGNRLEAFIAPTGSGVEDDYQPGLTFKKKSEIRLREQRASLGFFGLPQSCFQFLEMENDSTDQVRDSEENRERIRALFKRKSPDVVFLPHGNDTNCAHRAIYRMARQAIADMGRSAVLFMNRDPKTINMRSDLYMPFGDEMAKWKAKLLRFHDTQQHRNLRTRGKGLDARLLELNRSIAQDLEIDDEFAEAFEVEIIKPDKEDIR